MKALILASLLALTGCATLAPPGFGEITADNRAECPVGMQKVCVRPASELICECH